MLAFWLLIHTLLSVASSLKNLVLIFPECRCGFCYLELENIPAGIYNIIPSTFLPKQEGPFFLDFNSIIPIKTTQLQWQKPQRSLDLILTKHQLFNQGHRSPGLCNPSQNRMTSLKTFLWNLVLKSGCVVRTVCGQNYPPSVRSTVYVVLCVYRVGLHLGAMLYKKV